MSQTELSLIAGVGEATADALWLAGFHSVADLADAAIEDIAAVPGFGYVRAQRIRAQAKEMSTAVVAVTDSADSDAVVALGDAPIAEAEEKAKAKKKSAKKDKGGSKDKKKGKKKDKKRDKKKSGKKDRKGKGKKADKGKKK